MPRQKKDSVPICYRIEASMSGFRRMRRIRDKQ